MGGQGGKGSHRTCEICGEKERGNHEGKPSLFSQFPLDENRCKAWLKAVGKEELVYLPIEKLHKLKHVCIKHFSKQDINKKGNRLKRQAIPMLNLTAVPLSDIQMDMFGFPQHIKRHNVPGVKKLAEMTQSVIAVPSTSQQDYSTVDQLQIIPGVKESLQLTQTVNAVPSTSQQDISTVDQLETIPGVKGSAQMTHCVDAVPSTSRQNISTVDMLQPVTTSAKRPIKSRDVENSVKKRKLMENPELQQTSPIKLTSESEDNRDVSRTCSSVNAELILTPRKRKLLEQLKKTKCTIKSLRRSANIIEKIDSPVLKELVLDASKNQRRNPKGKRWTMQNKISALAIFKRSPKTYRYLNKIMPLPSEKTLHNILKKIPMQPGINKAVIEHLKTIAGERDSKSNICCLLFDEMALKMRLIHNIASDIIEGYEDLGETLGRSRELADHALVFMLQGLHQKFKQPLAFYLVKGTISSQKLANIIKEIIKEVASTGFRILNTVCDQGPTNMGALKILRESSMLLDDSSNHCFKIDEHIIYIVYDVPHLFKSIRNNFLKNGTVELNGIRANWAHLIELEELNRSFLRLSKLSQMHVDPKYRAKMRVKYAAQVLSNTTVAVLKMMAKAERNHQHGNALMNSALVIQEFDILFDITNGPSGYKDIKKGQRENVSEKTDHLNKWAKSIKALDTLKFIDKRGNEARNVKCVNGYIITLKSLRHIWQTLNAMGFKYLNLRQVNQDAIENLFGVIRQNNPTNRNPTCSHFISSLKTAVITKLSSHHSRGSNCEADNKTLLTDFQNLVFKDKGEVLLSCEDNDGSIESKNELIDEEYPILCIPEEDLEIENDLSLVSSQAAVYVSGYLASRNVAKSNCKQCCEQLKVRDPTNVNIYDYIKFREWWQDQRSLTYPTVELCRVVQTAINIMEKEICPRLHDSNISQLAVTMFVINCDTNWFTCTLHREEIFKMLFNRLSLLLIRRQCQRINQGLALQEEKLADANKLAQQQGRAK